MPKIQKALTKRIRLYGIVQGVGFRPFVSREAMSLGISGSVCNRGSYVEVIAQGDAVALKQFTENLRTNSPERSVILKVDVKDAGLQDGMDSFEIIESEKEAGEIFISPDIATCPECRRELFDPSNRRYLHPFINCTQCGPRLTILDELPYDRDRTSMKEFPMCPQCAEEYVTPSSRRYDAQPVCCNDCGPEVYLTGRPERGSDAIKAARQMLTEGRILAVKGIGGYHLCCDASSDEAVRRLRERKMRPVKPFAVMMRDEETVERNCFLNEEQRRILTGHQKPILLLQKKERSTLSSLIAPGNPKVGVMLPYAPVQMLLFDYPDDLTMPDMLVMTSGNVSGAPICRDDEEAVRELGSFADAILSHNRKIRIRCDDSVMDFENQRPYMIRRSRGYAPLPVLLSEEYRSCVLAVGGELKNTFCLGIGNLFYPSAYVGDLADPRSVRALQESITRMETLLERKGEVIACDLHPGYHSTALAQELAKERGIELIQIQHHFAHIVSCMAENDIGGEVLGASFDGTGWGEDGTIWGGELMHASRSGYKRIGSIQPFHMSGGDQASREGWRVAASMIHDIFGTNEKAEDKNTGDNHSAGTNAVEKAAAKRPAEEANSAEKLAAEKNAMVKTAADMTEYEIIERLSLCQAAQFRTIALMSDRGMNTVISTSAGRLFDAVSAILGICRESTFEGEAAISLQFAAEAYASKKGLFRDDAKQAPIIKCERDQTLKDQRDDDLAEEDQASKEQEYNNLAEVDQTLKDQSENDQTKINQTSNSQSMDIRIDEDGFMTLPTDILVRDMIEGVFSGCDREELSYRFHDQLAAMISDALLQSSRKTGLTRAVLSGGVYQNTLLLDLTRRRLEEGGMTVYTHHLIPPNDGGICLGQAAAAQEILKNRIVKQ